MDLEKVRAKTVDLLLQVVPDRPRALKIETQILNWAIKHCLCHGYGVWDEEKRSMVVYWEHPHVRHMYRCKAVNTVQCLKRHPSAQHRLLAKRLTVKTLIFDKPWAVVPEMWEKSFEAAAHRQLRREIVGETSFDGLLECNRCKSRKVTYCILQTRAADEASTVFAYCTNCSKRWKTS